MIAIELEALELEALCNVLMEADPWENYFNIAWREPLEDLANRAALEHGYDGWIEALHRISEMADQERADNGQFGVGA